LDIHHDVDAFFELDTNRFLRRVTIDITLKRDKSGKSADVVINKDEIESGYLGEIAELIAYKLTGQLDENM
jgi:hypothetical protein